MARTLIDLAATEPPRRLEQAWEQAELLRVLDLGAVEELLARSHDHRGAGRLRALAAEARPPPPLTRSELERRFLEVCHAARLPPPATNVWVAGMEVDAVWETQRLAVELDGYAFHHSRQAFERDRQRSAALLRAGYRPLRITHRRLMRKTTEVTEELRELLGL